jgi:hypothetical protein
MWAIRVTRGMIAMWATGVERAIAAGEVNIAVAMDAVATEATAHQVHDQARADDRHRGVSKMNTIPDSVHPSVPISAPDANRRNVQREAAKSTYTKYRGTSFPDRRPGKPAICGSRLGPPRFVQAVFVSRLGLEPVVAVLTADTRRLVPLRRGPPALRPQKLT